MNKKQLIEAIEGYPDDATILVAVGNAKALRDCAEGEPSLVYKAGTNLAFAISLGDSPDIVLEL